MSDDHGSLVRDEREGKTERDRDRDRDRETERHRQTESGGLVSRWGLNHKEMKGVEVRRDDDDDPRGDGSASPNGFEPQEDDPEGDDESKMEMIRRETS